METAFDAWPSTRVTRNLGEIVLVADYFDMPVLMHATLTII